MGMFDPQPTLENGLLHLRPLHDTDRAGLFAVVGHPEVWAGHPAQDRYKPEVFGPYFESLLATKTALCVLDRASEKVIGTSSFYTPPDIPGGMAIGFTVLACEYWGGQYNRALKQLMIDHVFTAFDEVWFHIAPENIRSQKATMKIGAQHRYDAMLNISAGHVMTRCYAIRRADWQQRKQDNDHL